MEELLTKSPYELALRKVRGRLAHANHIEPFKVFTNQMLLEILSLEPKTIVELCTIKGFREGGTRAEKFGPDIIAVFNITPRVDALKF